MLADLQHNPIHVYSKVNPIEFSRIYPQESGCRTAALCRRRSTFLPSTHTQVETCILSALVQIFCLQRMGNWRLDEELFSNYASETCSLKAISVPPYLKEKPKGLWSAWKSTAKLPAGSFQVNCWFADKQGNCLEPELLQAGHPWSLLKPSLCGSP